VFGRENIYQKFFPNVPFNQKNELLSKIATNICFPKIRYIWCWSVMGNRFERFSCKYESAKFIQCILRFMTPICGQNPVHEQIFWSWKSSNRIRQKFQKNSKFIFHENFVILAQKMICYFSPDLFTDFMKNSLNGETGFGDFFLIFSYRQKPIFGRILESGKIHKLEDALYSNYQNFTSLILNCSRMVINQCLRPNYKLNLCWEQLSKRLVNWSKERVVQIRTKSANMKNRIILKYLELLPT